MKSILIALFCVCSTAFAAPQNPGTSEAKTKRKPKTNRTTPSLDFRAAYWIHPRLVAA